MSESVRQK